MFPRVDTAAQAREAIGFMRFPPDGVRGVAAQNRTGRFGRVAVADLGSLDDDLIGIVQIETLASVAEIEGIAAVDGVDVLFVGPGDLSYALGVPGRFDNATYREALQSVVRAARSNGRSAGVLVRDIADAERHLELGFRFIGIGSDSSMVMSAATATVGGFRNASAGLPR
jgi:2-dehydro-3-deoxyglucarate aldolase/4-hydroxy-2-oxoheptanedioate aldolase